MTYWRRWALGENLIDDGRIVGCVWTYPDSMITRIASLYPVDGRVNLPLPPAVKTLEEAKAYVLLMWRMQ